MSHFAMLQKCIAMLLQSLRNVEPDSTWCNSCCNKIVARDLMIGDACYNFQFRVQFVSQLCCRNKLREKYVTQCNSALEVKCAHIQISICKTQKLRREQNFDWMKQLLKQIRVNLSLQPTCSLRVGYDCYRKDRNGNGGGCECCSVR